ncbi:MAG TPA: CHRD domain-containing protein [Pyrinomonadaceae bacterium]|nr:CHRD domain-containing protein [Pyrinomonadaceae bacterium]
MPPMSQIGRLTRRPNTPRFSGRSDRKWLHLLKRVVMLLPLLPIILFHGGSVSSRAPQRPTFRSAATYSVGAHRYSLAEFQQRVFGRREPALALANASDTVAALERSSTVISVDSTISGRVTNVNGRGLANATVSFTGASEGTTNTNNNGDYSIVVPAGTYTLSASYTTAGGTQVQFDPFDQEVDAQNNVVATTFVAATPTFSVSGTVKNGSGTGFAGVTITLSGTNLQPFQIITGANGNYESPQLQITGDYTFTPQQFSSSGITFNTFNPSNRSFPSIDGCSVDPNANCVGFNYLGVDFTASSLPIVTTSTATAVTSTTATLNGSVNPNGLATNGSFEWGTDPTLTINTTTTQQSVGAGTSSQPVTANLNGLTASTTYYFRTVASSSAGTAKGSILSFATTTSTVQFSAANFNVTEGNTASVTVMRSGDTSGTTSVDYATGNNTYAPCDLFNGTALQNCDFTVNSGRLTFGPGQTSETVFILTTDDAHVEGNETLPVTLSNTLGGVLGSPSTATITIVDNDNTGAPSVARKQFVAILTGTQEVPFTGNVVKGNGGVVQLSTDETTASVSLFFSGLTGNETGAHVHGPAAAGTNADILFPLPLGNPINNFQISPTAQQVADLKAGLHYMNVHSAGFPDGEIRGQLLWNPIEEATLFVTQQYYDFLSREPDAGGLNFWLNDFGGGITPCGSDVVCLRNRRITVADAFFFEPEFQQTGSYVLRLYRAAYGNTQPLANPDLGNPAAPFYPGADFHLKFPSYAVFRLDRAQVVGGPSLAQSQLALANDFVQRPDFLNKYAAGLSGPEFVDAVLATIMNNSGADLTSQRTALINLFNSGGRGAVMYRLADDNVQTNPINNRAFIDAEYNLIFVTIEYFGYLRRDGDANGLNFWLTFQVNRFPPRDTNIQHAMVCSFITSAEYQLRFGGIVTRNNDECPQ